MTKLQKVKNFIFGLGMLVVAIVMFIYPKDAYEYVCTLLAVGFLISGLGTLSYYFAMARYMVGGRLTLYKGVILIDFALVSGSIADVPRMFVIIYLAVLHLFSGFVEILRSRESIVNGSKHWKLKMMHGIVNIAVSIGCIYYARRTNTAVYMYCIGLAYSAMIRIISTFRKTTLQYVR